MPLKAGTAIRDISPQKPMFLVGYPHVERTSTGVHDPLLASALYLSSGKSSALLVALDILFLDPPTARKLRREIAQNTGVAEQCVFIGCSHTHSGPVTMEMLSWQEDPIVPRVDPSYMEFLTKTIIEAATAATKKTRDAELAWTSAVVDGVGCNRHDPNGPRDPEASILVVRDPATKRVHALSVTYSMHPTVMHEDSTLISADFPFYTRLQIQEKIGKDVVVLYHTGPEGDQSPRYHVKGQTFAEAERLGRRLGIFVSDAVQLALKGSFDAKPEIRGGISQVLCPTRSFPSVAETQANLVKAQGTFEQLKRDKAGHGPVRTAECTVFGAEEAVQLAKAQQDGHLKDWLKPYLPIDVQVVRIGERCLAGLPGEVFVEYALTLKRMAKRKAVAVCLVNGEMQGYVVTAEAARKGGYEAGNAVFAPISGVMLTNAALELISRM